jgi:hypothetical protein
MTEQTPAVNDEAVEQIARSIYEADRMAFREWFLIAADFPATADRYRFMARAALTAALPFLSQQVDPREQIARAIQAAKPKHITRDYTPVDQAYDHAARVARETPLTRGGDEIHAYGAAGYLVCGLETGGGISRHDGYTGPRRQSTTDDSRVTCPDCLAALSPAPEGEKR